MYVIYSMDTGSTNCGYTVTSYTKKSFAFEEIGMFDSPVKNLTDTIEYLKLTKAEKAKLAKQGKKRVTKEDKRFHPPLSEGFPVYCKTVNEIVDEFKVADVVAERFQTRGIGGPLIEKVSVMNGALITIAHLQSKLFRLITASQWKNAVSKIIDINTFYLCGKNYGFTPHEVDSTLIGLYHADYRGLLPFSKGLSLWKNALIKYTKK